MQRFLGQKLSSLHLYFTLAPCTPSFTSLTGTESGLGRVKLGDESLKDGSASVDVAGSTRTDDEREWKVRGRISSVVGSLKCCCRRYNALTACPLSTVGTRKRESSLPAARPVALHVM
jgi:hypothetical protein